MYHKLDEFLRSRSATYEVIKHSGAVTAQEQAATADVSGWSMAKVVIVKERDGLVMAVAPACCFVDLHRLKGLIGHGDVRLATVEEIGTAVPDCPPGAMPPFGRLFGLRSFVDRQLLNQRDIVLPAGDFETLIRMRASEFRRLDGFEAGDFAVPETLSPPERTTARPRARRRPGSARRTPRRA